MREADEKLSIKELGPNACASSGYQALLFFPRAFQRQKRGTGDEATVWPALD